MTTYTDYPEVRALLNSPAMNTALNLNRELFKGAERIRGARDLLRCKTIHELDLLVVELHKLKVENNFQR